MYPVNLTNSAFFLHSIVFSMFEWRYRNIKQKLNVLAVIAGSLESANSSILAARRFFKEVVGKKSGFYVN